MWFITSVALAQVYFILLINLITELNSQNNIILFYIDIVVVVIVVIIIIIIIIIFINIIVVIYCWLTNNKIIN